VQGGGALFGQSLFLQQATTTALGHGALRLRRAFKLQRVFSLELRRVVGPDDGSGLVVTLARFRVGKVERRPMAGLHGASISITIRRKRGEGARRDWTLAAGSGRAKARTQGFNGKIGDDRR